MLKCQFCCSAGGVWPAIVYTQTDTEGETERGQSPEYILKSSKKNNILWTPCSYPLQPLINYCAQDDGDENSHVLTDFFLEELLRTNVTGSNMFHLPESFQVQGGAQENYVLPNLL